MQRTNKSNNVLIVIEVERTVKSTNINIAYITLGLPEQIEFVDNTSNITYTI